MECSLQLPTKPESLGPSWYGVLVRLQGQIVGVLTCASGAWSSAELSTIDYMNGSSTMDHEL